MYLVTKTRLQSIPSFKFYSCACVCVYLCEGMSQMWGKWTLGPLELELEAIVSYSTRILGTTLGSSGSAPAISPAPLLSS